MADFKTLNTFLSDYLYSSGMLVFPSENDRARYPKGIHCYVLCPICGAKTSTEIIKGTRRFKSWQCGHLSSSSLFDYFMLSSSIEDISEAIKRTEELRNGKSVPFEGKSALHNLSEDKSAALRKKNLEFAERAFGNRDDDLTASYLKLRGIDFNLLPEAIQSDIIYTPYLEQISYSTGKAFHVSGVLLRNRYHDEVSYTLRKTGKGCYSRDGFRVLQIGKILPFGLPGTADSNVIAITEGAFDCLSFYSLGLPAISISGVANIKKVPLYLPQCCTDVVLALDNDEAGIRATEELREILRNTKYQSHIVRIGEGKDVNEWIQRNQQSLESSVNEIIKEVTDYEEDSCRNSY